MLNPRLINVEILDFSRGTILPLNSQKFFVAMERGPGIFRVNDGTYDFTFTESELSDTGWIRRIDG